VSVFKEFVERVRRQITESMRATIFIALIIPMLASLTAYSGEPAVTSGPAHNEPKIVDTRGKYFARKAYDRKPLPKFAETRNKLPGPIYDEDPACVDMYWKAWELAFRNFHEPAQSSGYVSQFIDAAFNQNVFLWDTCS